jgi:hypothetical protein
VAQNKIDPFAHTTEPIARLVCVNPCPPVFADLPPLKFRLPLGGGGISAVPEFSFKVGCDGCDVAAKLLLALQPSLEALGIPLCALGCLAQVLKVVMDLKDVMQSLPVPDVVKLLKDIAMVPVKCKCLLDLFIPALGLCKFILPVLDVLRILSVLLGCILSLVTHLLSLSLQVSIKLSDSNPSVQEVGKCLDNYRVSLMDHLLDKLGSVQNIFDLLGAILEIVSAFPGMPDLSGVIGDFSNLHATLSAPDMDPGHMLKPIQDVKDTIDAVVGVITDLLKTGPCMGDVT